VLWKVKQLGEMLVVWKVLLSVGWKVGWLVGMKEQVTVVMWVLYWADWLVELMDS
jgi:hypothetical protein